MREEVGVGFAVLGWFKRFRLPPPFFFLALSGFARSGPGVLVLVFALKERSPLLLRSPFGVPVK